MSGRPYDTCQHRRTSRELIDSGELCATCGQAIGDTAGHVVPARDGGPSDETNEIPQCRRCNGRDGGRRGQAMRRAKLHPPQQGGNYSTAPAR